MLYLTQLIYVVSGQEEIFHQFEDVAIPVIAKYNGQLLLRLRPQKDTVIQKNIEQPYEIHIITFDSEEDFERFKHDEERKKFLHLKEQSIRTSLLIKGKTI